MKKGRAALLLSLVMIVSSLGLDTLSSGHSGQGLTAPPAPIEGVIVIDNDWDVVDEVRFLNATIYLTGNLTVKSTGSLELVNTTLAMNINKNGQYMITIQGAFTMSDLDLDPQTQGDASTVKSNNSAFKYVMLAQSGSQLAFLNSILRDCGYDGLKSGLSVSGTATFDGMTFQNNYHGLVVKNSGVTVRNSTFLGGYYGLYSYFCNPVLKNLTITGATARGMYLYYSTPILEDCVLENNKIGIYFQNSEPNVRRCTVTGSTTAGVYAWYSSPLLVDCALSNTVDMDVRLASYPRLLDTQLNESRVQVDLGHYVSVGRRVTVSAFDPLGATMANATIAILDSQGNPASSGMTDETGAAAGLAFRERLLTRDGPIEMPTNTVMAFSMAGHDVFFGENATSSQNVSSCDVAVDLNPSGIELWHTDQTIAETRWRNDTRIIALGDIFINGGSLELENSELLMFSSGTRTVSVMSGILDLTGSKISSMGTRRVLEPSRVLVATDVNSPAYIQDSSMRWITEFTLRSSLSEISNLTVSHASSYGVRVLSSSPRIHALTIDWSQVGLHLSGDNSKLSDIRISRAKDYAVQASQSAATFSGLRVDNSSRGLYSYYGMLSLSDVAAENCDIGLYPLYTVLAIDTFSINGSNTAGIYAVDSDIMAINGRVSDSETALHIQTTGLWGESITMENNQVGLKSSGSAPVLLNSSLSNILDLDVDRGSSASLVNCALNLSRASVKPSGHIDLGNWFNVSVLDGGSIPVQGCNVSVLDMLGRVSGSGTTGEDGALRNVAFRERRLLWNGTEEMDSHTILAFNGTLQGAVTTTLQAFDTVEMNASASGMGWTEWASYTTILSNLSYSGTAVIAHAGALVDNDASLALDNSTLWVFGSSQSNTIFEIKTGALNMHNSSIVPIRARAPLLPSSVWIIYRAASKGVLADSRFLGLSQVTTYTSDLLVANCSFSEFSGTGLHVQACSPVIADSLFSRCRDGIWSNSGSPNITGSSFLECAGTGLHASGGRPELHALTSMHNVNGFKLTDGAAGNISECAAEGNDYGLYMNAASPRILSTRATGNVQAGFYCQDAHPTMASVESSNNMIGLYCYKSWPVVTDSVFSQNTNGIDVYQSAPYLAGCEIDGNSIGYNSIGDARGIAASTFASGKSQEHATFVGGGTRDHISITIPSRAVVRSANISIRGSELGGDAVIEDKYTQYYPAIHGHWIVWQDRRDEDWDIYAYDLSMDSDGNGVPNYLETPPLADDPALVRITDNPYMQSEPDIYGDTIVWTDYRNGDPDIYAYTFSNSTEWAVYRGPNAQLKPAIHGDRIVWQDYSNGNYDIYMLNISRGEVSRLSDSPDHDMGARIHGDYVVWYSYYGSPPSNDYSDIHLFDIKTWSLSNINKDDPLQYNPDVYESTVVWHDNRNGNWEIYTYDIETAEVRRLTYDPDNQQNFIPRIHGDKAVYYFHNRITGLWSARMSNLTTGAMTVLERDLKGDSHPTIHGQRIAWVNRTGNMNDVYVLDYGLSGLPSDVRLDINADGTFEYEHPGELDGTEYISGTWLADVLNKNLARIDGGISTIPMSVTVNGTGRIIMGPISVKYDIPSYLVNCTVTNSSTSGARLSGSGPTFVNSTLQANALDFSMNYGARPTALNTAFSESMLFFQDKLSNLTVQNFLHVRVQNLTGDPLDAGVKVEDNGMAAHDVLTGEDGQAMWMPVTDRTHNITGRHENATMVTVIMGTTQFPDNPRYVNMSSSHWEVFSTDSVGPEVSDPFPPPGWTTPLLRPEISVIITDTLGVDLSTVRLYVQNFAVYYDYSGVPDGYNISYQHPMDFPNGSVVNCRIYGRDIHGNAVDFSWEFKIDVRAEAFAIPLDVGWNLVSIPFAAHNSSVESVLWPIAGKYDWVLAYSSIYPGGPWLGYRPGLPEELNKIANIDRKSGYWIHATEPCVLTVSGVPAESTSITLHAGWNLVGYPVLAEKTVANALWGTGADRVETFWPESPYITEADPNHLLGPGQGFWVRVNHDTVWVIDW